MIYRVSNIYYVVIVVLEADSSRTKKCLSENPTPIKSEGQEPRLSKPRTTDTELEFHSWIVWCSHQVDGSREYLCVREITVQLCQIP